MATVYQPVRGERDLPMQHIADPLTDRISMKIAHVIQRFECGGDVAMVAGLSSCFADRGHTVDVFCLDRPTGGAHERHWLNVLKRHGVSFKFLGRKARQPGFIAALKLWRLIQRGGYDIVHSHLSMPDAMTGVIRRITVAPFKHVLTVHSSREGRSWIRAICAGGGNVVYCSQAARKLSRPLMGVSSAVIPNGITQSPYTAAYAQRTQTRQQLEIPEDAFVVILVGRMCAQKRFDLAIDALTLLRQRAPQANLRFLFCGDGEEKPRLEAQAMRAGLNSVVKFCGSRTDIPAVLGASDVFLSMSAYEGMPLTVLEALTVGLPCVLSQIDEHYEIARTMPGCAFAPSDDPEQVASALEFIMNKRVSPSALKFARASLLEKFSISDCANSYLSLYNSLCNS